MASKPKQIFNFDLARSRSHLFFRYLGTHPDSQCIWHPFLNACLSGPERIVQYTANFDRDGNKVEYAPGFSDMTYADAADELRRTVIELEKAGKIPTINEHSPLVCKQEIALALIRGQHVDISPSSNPTVIPDDIFASLTPIIVIRRPVYSVPSVYKLFSQTTKIPNTGEDWKLTNGIVTTRYLFDYFCQRDGKPPIVVDGDDVVWRTDQIRDKLEKALDLGPGLSDVWQPVPESEWFSDPMLHQALFDINNSTGIVRSSEHPQEPDLDRAWRDWCERYGQETADQLRVTVEQNMPHYEYLVQFKI